MSSAHAAGKTALVTVGSTAFPSLVARALSPPTLASLRAAGFGRLLVQFGASPLPTAWRAGSAGPSDETAGVELELFAFRDGIEALYEDVDLVISHAGAGSILTSLRAGKVLITVVNASFLDNHQSELADELGGRGHLLVATPETLEETIHDLPMRQQALKAFPPADPTAFLRMVDEEAGYA